MESTVVFTGLAVVGGLAYLSLAFERAASQRRKLSAECVRLGDTPCRGR